MKSCGMTVVGGSATTMHCEKTALTDEIARLREENDRLRERLRRVLDGDDIDAENERLRHRVQVARSTVELLRSYINALHAGGIDDDLLTMMRDEEDRAITTWRALTEPAALETDWLGDVGEPT